MWVEKYHAFIWSQFYILDLIGEVSGVVDVMESVHLQECQESGELFYDVVDDRVDISANGSEWGPHFVYLRKKMHASVASPG